jgi:hypothetical protein
MQTPNPTTVTGHEHPAPQTTRQLGMGLDPQHQPIADTGAQAPGDVIG